MTPFNTARHDSGKSPTKPAGRTVGIVAATIGFARVGRCIRPDMGSAACGPQGRLIDVALGLVCSKNNNGTERCRCCF